MKTKLFLIITTIMVFHSFTTNARSQSREQKVLVVYFSYGGNTQIIANRIQELTKGDILRIEPVNPYPESYNAVVEQAKKEIEANYKPAIKNKIGDMGRYDVIFVGSPNWWGTIAPPVATFLSGHDFPGKTIVPFITHEGSRMGRSVSEIKKLCPSATVSDGFSIRGSSVKTAGEDVRKWLQQADMLK